MGHQNACVRAAAGGLPARFIDAQHAAADAADTRPLAVGACAGAACTLQVLLPLTLGSCQPAGQALRGTGLLQLALQLRAPCAGCRTAACVMVTGAGCGAVAPTCDAGSPQAACVALGQVGAARAGGAATRQPGSSGAAQGAVEAGTPPCWNILGPLRRAALRRAAGLARRGSHR